MAKTGETRKTKQPLKIDRLSASVHDAILYLRNVRGKTWDEIEALSAEKYSAEWKSDGKGFIDWDNIETPVLELFPDMKLPHTNLHRWYDLRVAQVTRDVEQRSSQARMIAEAFSRSVVKDGDKAVMYAARDTFMSVLSEDGSVAGRQKAAKALIALAEVMQTARANDIKERKVAVDERRIAAVEAREKAAQERLTTETERLTKKANKGRVTVEDINRLRERVFALPPKPTAEATA